MVSRKGGSRIPGMKVILEYRAVRAIVWAKDFVSVPTPFTDWESEIPKGKCPSHHFIHSAGQLGQMMN